MNECDRICYFGQSGLCVQLMGQRKGLMLLVLNMGILFLRLRLLSGRMELWLLGE